MRALLAGISGIGKDTIIANLVSRLAHHGDIPGDLAPDGDVNPTPAPARGDRYLCVANIEAALAEQGHELAGILASFRPHYQLSAWRQAGQGIAERLDALGPQHALIATHLTYYTSGRQFSLIDLPTIRRWQPDCIITLVDEMLDIHAALQHRDADRHTHFGLRLREILTWRAAEIAMADFLARSLYAAPIPHYVVSVKHPTEMLYRLIFHPDQYPVVYASFPITAIRYDAALREDINRIRQELHQLFIVFDPLTLDEGTPEVFAKARAAVVDSQSEIVIDAAEARWPFAPAGSLIEGRPDFWPMRLDPGQALEVWDDMENQIRHRDLTMVEQAQCVAAYRITLGGRLSTGMYSELMYATHTAEPARPVLMYADPDDAGLDHPFLRNFTHRTFQDLDEWYTAIRQLAPAAVPGIQKQLF